MRELKLFLHSKPQVYPHNGVSYFLMKLSPVECAELCDSNEGKQIISSRHLVVQHEQKIYKMIYLPSEDSAFRKYVQSVTLAPSPPSMLIHPVEIYVAPNVTAYSYNCIQYSSLKKQQANDCIRSLVKGIHDALSQLHSLGLSHNNI